MKSSPQDACHCGSGKPYQQCCGSSKVTCFEVYKWPRLARTLQGQLLQFAEEDRFLADSEAAFQLYLDMVAGEMLESEEEPVFISFVDWFTYDYPLAAAGGRTLLQVFMEEKAAHLGPMEMELLRYWTRAVISLLRVKEASWGQVVLEDLVVGGEYPLQEVPGPHGVVPGTLVLGRLIRVGEAYAFAGSALEFTPLLRDEILNIVERLFNAWKKEAAEATRLAFLKEEGFRLPALIGSALEEDDAVPFHLPGSQEDDFQKRDRRTRHLAISQLEQFYAHWVHLPLPALEGRTPWEVSQENGESHRVGRLLDDLQSLSRNSRAGEGTRFDFDRVRRLLGLGPWAHLGSGFSAVQRLIEGTDNGPGFRAVTLRVWHDYYAMVQPRVKKAQGWMAALDYVVSRLVGMHEVTQQDLAREYRVSVATVSRNARHIWKTLDLKEMDRRYAVML